MKVAVFGANGRTGRLLTARALDDGHTVVAATRHVADFPLTHPRLDVREVDVYDAAAVADTVRSADAVLSTLGPGVTPWNAGIRFNVHAAHDRARPVARPRPEEPRMSMPPYGIKPGRRKAGPHRCSSLLHALGWTLLSAAVPGAGFLHNRRQRLGALLVLVSLVGVVWVDHRTTCGLPTARECWTRPAGRGRGGAPMRTRCPSRGPTGGRRR